MADDPSLERAKLAIDLAKVRFDRLHSRRAYEWKMSLGLWAAMLSSIIAVHRRPSDIYIGCALLLLNVIYFVSWVMPLARRNALDSKVAFFFFDIAANQVQPGTVQERGYPTVHYKDRGTLSEWQFRFSAGAKAALRDGWSGIFPMILTITISAAVFFLMGRGLDVANLPPR